MASSIVSGVFLAAAAFSRSVSAAPTVSSVGQVKTAVNNLSEEVKTLAGALSSFANDGNGTYEQALAIHDIARKVAESAGSAKDIVNTLGQQQLSEADGQDIFNQFAGIAPAIEQAIEQLQAKQADFVKLTPDALKTFGQPSNVVISITLEILVQVVIDLKVALLPVIPTSLQPNAQALAARILGAVSGAGEVFKRSIA